MAAPKPVQKPEDIEWEANARDEFKASQNRRAPKPVQKPEDIAYEANALKDLQENKRLNGGVTTGVVRPGIFDNAPVKDYAKGGSVGSASKRADGCAQRGKTKGKMR
jgi:hypothetical protein